jgi:hypothetical protein
MGYFLDKSKSTILDIDSEIIPTGIRCVKSAKSVKSPPLRVNGYWRTLCRGLAGSMRGLIALNTLNAQKRC